jgi:hypothetical protein
MRDLDLVLDRLNVIIDRLNVISSSSVVYMKIDAKVCFQGQGKGSIWWQYLKSDQVEYLVEM